MLTLHIYLKCISASKSSLVHYLSCMSVCNQLNNKQTLTVSCQRMCSTVSCINEQAVSSEGAELKAGECMSTTELICRRPLVKTWPTYDISSYSVNQARTRHTWLPASTISSIYNSIKVFGKHIVLHSDGKKVI